MKSIWCLFSIYNEYNQPDNNLHCAWLEKPDIHSLVDVLSCERNKEAYKAANSILKDKEVRWGGSDYRLQKIKEGERI